MKCARKVFNLFNISQSDLNHHEKRINDILYKKAIGNEEKQISLAKTMAAKITDVDKAYGRYLVCEDLNAPHLAKIFLYRFKELTYTIKDWRREKLMMFFDENEL